jgi:hypothetical protein
MIESIDEFERQLNALDPDPDEVAFVADTNLLLEQLSPILHPYVFDTILRFFESHSDSALGAPGPLVHHIEQFFPNYVDSLIGSVARKPSYCGVWMINRILNSDVDFDLRQRLMAALVAAASPDRLTAVHVREMADDFVKLHL